MPLTTKAEFSKRLDSRNTSGAPGVYLQRCMIKGTAYFFWQVCSPEGGQRRKTRSSAVSKYGHDDAYALTVQTHAEFVAEEKGYAAINRISAKFRP